MKALLLLLIILWSVNTSASENKAYSLQFVDLFAKEVLISNYKKQLKGRIFEQTPAYKNQEADVDTWLNVVFASGQYQEFLAHRYKLLFTEQEFKDLVTFYKTETGKKFLTIAPKMTTMSATVAGQLILKNLPELDKYLKLQKQKTN